MQPNVRTLRASGAATLKRHGVPQQRSSSSTLLRSTVVTIVVLLAAFAISAILLRQATVSEIQSERSIRQVSVEADRVIQLQLDEETGLRGFSLTHGHSFLQPLGRARAEMPSAFIALRGGLQKDDPAALPLENVERAINARWLRDVALPVIAHPWLDTNELEVHGKTLVDRLRSDNDSLEASLARINADIDQRGRALVENIVFWSFALGAVLAICLFFYAYAQARSLHDLNKTTEAYERERSISQALQEAFLLEKLPQTPNLTFDAAYRSAQKLSGVGGDWYGVIRLLDGRIFFSVGDVAGHGIDAAVLMTRARQTLLSCAAHETSPAVALARTNGILRLRSERMVTALCGYIDATTNEFVFASAGHPPPLLFKPTGESEYMLCQGGTLGVLPDPKCRDCRRVIEPGSSLVFYTDGLLEFDRNLAVGERRLLKVAGDVVRERTEKPAGAIVSRTLGSAKARDDIAVLVITFAGVRALHMSEAVS